ncbi:MAG: EF-hand domain-containing protein [Proteobacteria bacterium]|nr:EF-hand domain-containing protein [Pseudomonadota bacterium]
MKLVLAFAVAALGATGVAAYAQQGDHMTMMRHQGGPMLDIDTNHDGWISRAEAAAAADRMFDQLDTNHDGRLTEADHPRMEHDVDVRIEGPAGAPASDDRNCTRTVEGNRVTVICSGEEGAGSSERRVIIRRGDQEAPQAESGRHVEREVTIITRGDGENESDAVTPAPPGAPRAPLPPRVPHPPMFMMLIANSDEMDTNHDGAISRDEFRAQQLRFFDASDANGDGRIRFEPSPEPPAPPTPPAAPPAPPAPTPPPPPR